MTEHSVGVERSFHDRLVNVWGSTRRFFSDPMAFSAGVVVLFLLLAAILAPLIAPYDPAATDAAKSLQGSSGSHFLGTDQLGRDILSRILYGSRLTLMV